MELGESAGFSTVGHVLVPGRGRIPQLGRCFDYPLHRCRFVPGHSTEKEVSYPDSRCLRVTPAMEAGVADHVWGVEEVVALLD